MSEKIDFRGDIVVCSLKNPAKCDNRKLGNFTNLYICMSKGCVADIALDKSAKCDYAKECIIRIWGEE